MAASASIVGILHQRGDLLGIGSIIFGVSRAPSASALAQPATTSRGLEGSGVIKTGGVRGRRVRGNDGRWAASGAGGGAQAGWRNAPQRENSHGTTHRSSDA